MSAITEIISNSMVVDYIRVRKSNIKEINELIEKRKSDKLMLIALFVVPALVILVAIVGLITTL